MKRQKRCKTIFQILECILMIILADAVAARWFQHSFWAEAAVILLLSLFSAPLASRVTDLIEKHIH